MSSPVLNCRKDIITEGIPFSDVRHYFKKEEYYNTKQGFIARSGDGMPYVSYDDIVECFRLDYSWSDDVTGKHYETENNAEYVIY